jgi:hypothetical protein
VKPGKEGAQVSSRQHRIAAATHVLCLIHRLLYLPLVSMSADLCPDDWDGGTARCLLLSGHEVALAWDAFSHGNQPILAALSYIESPSPLALDVHMHALSKVDDLLRKRCSYMNHT